MSKTTTSTPNIDKERLDILASYEILDTKPEQEYSDIIEFAMQVCSTPIASISFVDQDRIWFKDQIGLKEKELPLNYSFCTDAIKRSKPLVIEDTKANPAYSEKGIVNAPPFVRFYTGIPLISEDGIGIGTLNVMDTEPRTLKPIERESLVKLGQQICTLLELRRTRFQFENQKMLLDAYKEQISLMGAEILNINHKDELTDLWNKKSFMFELNKELSRSRRTGDTFAILKFEIDQFNDMKKSHSLEYSNEILRSLGHLFIEATRDTDFCARIDPDQFVVLMPNIDRAKANLAANRIRTGIKSLNKLHNEPITASIGAAIVLAAQAEAEDIMALSEKCLNRAKTNGGNQIEIEAFYGA